MSVYHQIRQLVVQEFFSQKGLILLENDKNWNSFVFTVSSKHIKIKSLLKFKLSVWPTSSLNPALTLYNHIWTPDYTSSDLGFACLKNSFMIKLFLLHFQFFNKNSGAKTSEEVQNKIKANEVNHVK